MDTGIVPHVDFGNRIRYFGDFCEGKTGLYDDNGHGTHVSGIVAGSGEASRKEYGTPVCHGIAPQADIVMLKVLDAKGNGNTRDVLAGMEWIAKNQQEYQIRLLNISVGMLPSAGEREQQELLSAVDDLWDRGIMVVAAAGNNGPKDNSVTIPGISRKIVTIGSSDDGKSELGKRGLKTGYSSNGPTACCIVKPEILAPGTAIKSCGREKNGIPGKERHFHGGAGCHGCTGACISESIRICRRRR